MKKRYIFLILGILSLLFITPKGLCESGKEYLKALSDSMLFSFNVEPGDIIRGDYQTYDSPFSPHLLAAVFPDGTIEETWSSYPQKLDPSGWFEIEVISCPGSAEVRLSLSNLENDGYIEYNIRNLGEEARIASALLWGSIIGGISIVSVIGIAFYFHKKKKKREPIK